jgi:hypothetical protein
VNDLNGAEIDPRTPLEGQVYQPSPLIQPDIRTGYDSYGDYHAIQQEQISELDARTKLMITFIIQQITGEDPNENVLLRATEIEEENGLPWGVSAEDIYNQFIRTRRET